MVPDYSEEGYKTWKSSEARGQGLQPLRGQEEGILHSHQSDLRQNDLGLQGKHHVFLQGPVESGGNQGQFIQFQTDPVTHVGGSGGAEAHERSRYPNRAAASSAQW